jgi:uncharacterized cupredoxin-like copper-binding protein
MSVIEPRSAFGIGPARLSRAVGVIAAIVACAVLPVASQAASSPAKAKVTTITVSAGKPSELAFKLSKISKIPAGTVIFKVTNAGKISHDFVICLVPTAKTPNSCVGNSKKTAFLTSGKSAVVTVKLLKTGYYEYLCSFPGHAAAGMKGLIGVNVGVTPALVAKAIKASAATTTTTTTTSSGTTTTSAPPPTTTTGGGGGTTTAGDGCPAGTTIPTSGNTDNDQDENGQPSDGDGCI